MKKSLIAIFLVAVCMFTVSTVMYASGVTFNINMSRSVTDETMDGRAFVIISTNYSSEPKNQISVSGTPFWGLTVDGVKPGENIIFVDGDSKIVGYPLENFSDIPAGEYYVQAFFAVYNTYHRSDGKVIKAEDPGEGGPQRKFTNPGNLYSEVKKVYIDPNKDTTVDLALTQVVQPTNQPKDGEVIQQGNYPDTKYVKYVKIKSELLSEFWGQDMYIGANVLLPNSYFNNMTTKYPVWYQQGHWPGARAPLSFSETNAFGKYWLDSKTPQMIVVEFRDANPYYGTSYSVNSANLGPYGDAITKELIPYLESEFRMIEEGFARLLSGGSTGGWEAMALQVFYPDYFGGTWPLAPDSFDFTYFQLINIYSDINAYFTEYAWFSVPRPSARYTDGNIRYTMQQENYYERALGGDNSISGGQWSVWEAVYGPTDVLGYPARIWDPITGVINKTVAAYWRENFDIRHYMETNWSTIGSKLVGKIHIRGGEMDTYYLNNGIFKTRAFLESTTAPYYGGYVKTFPQLGHTGNISNQELLIEMADHLIKNGASKISSVLYPKGK